MANTIAQMHTEIWGWTDTNSTRLDELYITRIVNGIIADLSRSADLLYNEFSETITTSANKWYYPLSGLEGKFSRPFSMWYTDSEGAVSRVVYVTPEEFEKRYWKPQIPSGIPPDNSDEPVGDTGLPKRYTIFAGDILFGPTPDAEYSLVFKYYGYPGDLISGTSTNDYLEYAWDIIQYGALAEVCKFLLEDNRIQLFASEYTRRKRRFFIEHARARTAGKRSQSHEQGWLED
jgi:hypothetical protein